MKILFMTDCDLTGSGYLNVSIPLLIGLANSGHDIIVAGLNYRGQQHDYPFKIIPTNNFQDFFAMFQNLANVWKFDVLMVAMDIPIHIQIMKILRQYTGFRYKYVGIMPVEADPLCFSYAAALLQMDKVYIISQFGADECTKMGIPAEHLQVGVDTKMWRVRTDTDKTSSRNALGLDQDAFIMCTVADNQERKNIVTAMDAFSRINKIKPNSKYILVTREHNLIGWRLRDYAMEIGISRDFMIVERGISQEELWTLMASADVFVLPSKAEGLGMPLLEAMAMGIPCVATDACGMKELLSDDRGWLIGTEYIHRDPFGNGRRYWIDSESLFATLLDFSEIEIDDKEERTIKSRRFVEGRSWDIPVDMVNKYLGGLHE
jgi:glycosyltransferase involved in cell wall biosynthesis